MRLKASMSPEMWSELDSLMQAQSLFIRGLKVFRAIMLREFRNSIVRTSRS